MVPLPRLPLVSALVQWRAWQCRVLDTGLGGCRSLHPQDFHYGCVASKCLRVPLPPDFAELNPIKLPLQSPGPCQGGLHLCFGFFHVLLQGPVPCQCLCACMCLCTSVQASVCLVCMLRTWVCQCPCLRVRVGLRALVDGSGCVSGCVSERARRNARGGWAARGGWGTGKASGAGAGRGLAAAGIWPLPARGGGWRESGEQKGEGRGAPAHSGSSGTRGVRGAKRGAESGEQRAGGACHPEPRGSGLAMEAPRGRGGLAALWCLGLLGVLARVAGTHYRYLWRGCYPCHLGRAGYPVSAADRRPGGRGELCAGGRAGPALIQGRCFCFLFKVCARGRLTARLEGTGLGQGPLCPESSDIPIPSLAWLRGQLTADRSVDQKEEKHLPAFAGGHRGCTPPWHWQLWGLSRRVG